MFDVPILFCIFNRPDTTQEVFNKIKEIKPNKLYVSADGPRKWKVNDYDLCVKTRDILTQIDWECDLHLFLRDGNVGCAKAIRDGINWFFEHEDRGIILEDDCVPSSSFFPFCQKMLDLYASEPNVMMISGYAPYISDSDNNLKSSYHFSRWANIWGWATWKDRWELYDASFPNWNQYKSIFLKDFYFKEVPDFLEWVSYAIDTNIISPDNTAWSWAWTYALFINSGLCVTPNVNLINNIGDFGVHGDHSKSVLLNTETTLMDISTIEIRKDIDADRILDNLRIKQYMRGFGILNYLCWKSISILRKFGFIPKNIHYHPMYLLLNGNNRIVKLVEFMVRK